MGDYRTLKELEMLLRGSGKVLEGYSLSCPWRGHHSAAGAVRCSLSTTVIFCENTVYLRRDEEDLSGVKEGTHDTLRKSGRMLRGPER